VGVGPTALMDVSEESNTENGASLPRRGDVVNQAVEGRRVERCVVAGDRRGFEMRRRFLHRQRRDQTSILDDRLQMPVQFTASLGGLGAMWTATVLGRGFELRGNTRRGAGRIEQERQDEDERHGPFYSGGRVRMES